MWGRNTFQRPAEPATLTGTVTGGPFGALQCFYLKLLEAGCLSDCRNRLSSSIPILGQFLHRFLLDSSPTPAALLLLQPRTRSRTSARQEVLLLPVCLTSCTGFLDGKAVHVCKGCICRPVRYHVGGQAAEPPLLPSFLFPLSGCCGHSKAWRSPCVSSFLLSEGKKLCHQWGWSFLCTYEFIQPAPSKCLLSGGCLFYSCI